MSTSTDNVTGVSVPHSHHKRGTKRTPNRSLQAASSLSEMSGVTITGYCDSAPTEWQLLPTFASFSLSADGSFPKVKSSKSSFIDLKTGQHETGIATGRCYRVYLG